MTEISSIIRGTDEESDRLRPCRKCGVLPTLEIVLGRFNNTMFLFSCPECGTESLCAYGIRVAKRNWNEEMAEIADQKRQKRVDDF